MSRGGPSSTEINVLVDSSIAPKTIFDFSYFFFIILDTQQIWFIGSSIVYCASKIAFSRPGVDVLVYRMQVVIFLGTAKGELNGGILIGLSKIIYTNSPLRASSLYS